MRITSIARRFLHSSGEFEHSIHCSLERQRAKSLVIARSWIARGSFLRMFSLLSEIGTAKQSDTDTDDTDDTDTAGKSRNSKRAPIDFLAELREETIEREKKRMNEDDAGADAEADLGKRRDLEIRKAKFREGRARAIEVNGPKGLEPTRFGDWERGGRCSDF
jgi:hypothetical protein